MTRTLRLLAFSALAISAGTSGALAQNLRPSATQMHRPQVGTTPSYASPSVTAQMRGPCRWVTHTTPYLYEKNTCSGEVRVLLR